MKPMLAKQYDGSNPAGCWMSEKLDGVRALWDGSHLMSRNDNEFAAPDWFIKGLPNDVILDGELWEGRGLFQQTVGKVRTKYNADWTGITFMVFDVVKAGTFEERMQSLGTFNLPPHVKILQQIKCKGWNHLDEFERRILALDGEGVMLRKSGSLYEHKRSSSLMKVKRFQSQEVIVAGYETGKGRNQGIVGALLCQFRSKIIRVGTGLSDDLRQIPPGIGSRITISFFELTKNGLPRFPAYIACRDYE